MSDLQLSSTCGRWQPQSSPERLPVTSRCRSNPPFGTLPSTDNIFHTMLVRQLASYLVRFKLCTSGCCTMKDTTCHHVSWSPELFHLCLQGWEGNRVQLVASGRPSLRRWCMNDGICPDTHELLYSHCKAQLLICGFQNCLSRQCCTYTAAHSWSRRPVMNWLIH